MKLVGELKEKVAQAESLEEVKKIIASAGIELTDEEVAAVTGGLLTGYIPVRIQSTPFHCAKEQEESVSDNQTV